MKRAAALLVLLACTLPLGATMQQPDEIRVAGKTYFLIRPLVIPPIRDNPAMIPPVMITSLWRGYVATWAIRDNRLYLDAVRVPRDSPPEDPSLRRWWQVMGDLFADDSPRVADWYTGNLVIPTGVAVGSAPLGDAERYTSYIVARVVNGRVRQFRRMKEGEFEAFRRERFAAWKKTPDYAKALQELDEKDPAKAEAILFSLERHEYVERITP